MFLGAFERLNEGNPDGRRDLDRTRGKLRGGKVGPQYESFVLSREEMASMYQTIEKRGIQPIDPEALSDDLGC